MIGNEGSSIAQNQSKAETWHQRLRLSKRIAMLNLSLLTITFKEPPIFSNLISYLILFQEGITPRW